MLDDRCKRFLLALVPCPAPGDELEPVGRHPAGAAVRTRPLARRTAPAGTEGMERSSFEPARGGPTGVRYVALRDSYKLLP